MELIFEERSSKGVVKDYVQQTSSYTPYKDPPYLYKTMMDMVKADPILFAAISLTVNLMTYKGYSFLGDNERAIKEAKKRFNEELDFDQVLDNLCWQMLVYGDAYLELRWNESKTKVIELHPLESTDMLINYTKNGEIIGYTQQVEGESDLDWPKFAPDEIIYFRNFWIGSQIYSHSPFQSIARSFATKIYANDYLQSLFRNLPPKMIYFLKNANKEQRKLFIENIIRAKTNSNLDIFAQADANGGFEAKEIQATFDQGLINIIELLRKEMLTITHVPPHWVGIMDGANRGIGENVVIPFESHLKKKQHKFESQINRELMAKVGFPALEFKFNAISLMDEKTIFEVANFMKAQGFDSETIIDYIRQRGIDLRQGAEIQEMELGGGGQVLQNETAMSRMDKNAKINKMGNNLDKKGVSADGAEKLEKKKVAA